MIHFFHMAKLVHNNIIDDFHRSHDQLPVKADITLLLQLPQRVFCSLTVNFRGQTPILGEKKSSLFLQLSTN